MFSLFFSWYLIYAVNHFYVIKCVVFSTNHEEIIIWKLRVSRGRSNRASNTFTYQDMVFGSYFIGRHHWENKDENKLPKDIPEVDEVGATSAPLLSASYYIGAKCKPYNDDFMMCKNENNGGTLECMKEGRRVTRCAVSVLKDINKHCLDEFKLHYECLEQENHNMGHCRHSEGVLGKCIFQNLKLEKKIPGVDQQIHLKENPIYQGLSNDKANTDAFIKARGTSSQ